MLLGALAFAVIAVLIARFYITRPDAAPQVQTAAAITVPVVVATAPLAFADKLTPDKFKLAGFPAAAVPAGSYRSIAEVVGTGDRTAMRSIEVNEPILPRSVSGKGGRLSASGLIGADMRAVAVPVTDVSGVAGFVASGDRVDVFVTRQVKSGIGASIVEQNITDMLLQNVRVLAVGQDADEAKSKPEVVRTATLEVTPMQAQKIALAQTVGSLSLSLRGIADAVQAPLRTVTLNDLRDGAGGGATVVRTSVRRVVVSRGPRKAPSNSIEIIRAGKSETYQVPVAG